eukprot:CAMPEP_0119070324 /NCGR_PEP_ID=MMETSP1178-20130426/37931_1 /TAXON_ID=33656 /ORGANISM="unid sp, Strain CCMP2000" /LENGTH=121 /DNA_ID=CAMNT_0007052149 /DNA_START=142 /DNA_END=507 /DNA_ORIENTATION=-
MHRQSAAVARMLSRAARAEARPLPSMHRSRCGAYRFDETCVPQLVQMMVSAVCFGRLPKTSSPAVTAGLGLRVRKADASSSSTSRTGVDAAAVIACSELQPSSSCWEADGSGGGSAVCACA